MAIHARNSLNSHGAENRVLAGVCHLPPHEASLQLAIYCRCCSCRSYSLHTHTIGADTIEDTVQRVVICADQTTRFHHLSFVASRFPSSDRQPSASLDKHLHAAEVGYHLPGVLRKKTDGRSFDERQERGGLGGNGAVLAQQKVMQSIEHTLKHLSLSL